LEPQLNLQLFDRKGYRNQLSPEGEIVLKHCRRILKATKDLEEACNHLQSGWEAKLQLFYDGVIDFRSIAKALSFLQKSKVPTEFRIEAAFLDEVKAKFLSEPGSLMVTILPFTLPQVESISLPPIRMHLVAHKDHALNHEKGAKWSVNDLQKETYIKVRETYGQLGLSTESISFETSFTVNDFTSKKLAIEQKLGFGWLPEYMMEKEMEKGLLIPLQSELKNRHTFKPKLYYRIEEGVGKTTQELIDQFS